MHTEIITGGIRLIETVETIRRIHLRHYRQKTILRERLLERLPADLPALLELRDLVPACMAYAREHASECPDLATLANAIEAWWAEVVPAVEWGNHAAICSELGTTDLPPVLAAIDAVRVWIDKQGAEERLQKTEVAPAVSGVADNPTRTKSGRPRRNETDGDSKVIAALTSHHKYEAWESGGSIGNYTPASVTDIAAKAGVGKATVSRFLQTQFEGAGHVGYKMACHGKGILTLLQAWNREPLERMARLRDNE